MGRNLGKNVSKELLKEWESFLSQKLNIDMALHIVDEDDLSSLLEIPFVELPENIDNLYFDITHAFRYFPLVISLSLPALKYQKNFKNFFLIYGKFKEGKSQIIFLKDADKIVKLSEAASLLEHTGSFSKFANLFKNKETKEKILEYDLLIETNQSINLNNLKRHLSVSNVYEKISVDFINNKLSVFDERKHPLKLAKRAVYFAEKDQFLKAYILIIESIVTSINPNVSEKSTYSEALDRAKEILSKKKKELVNVLKEIRSIRNSMAHGKPSKNKTRQILSNRKELKNYIYKGYEIVKILNENS